MAGIIKICGVTEPEDALRCLGEGADALGFISHPGSPRFVSPGKVSSIVSRCMAAYPLSRCVGVFVSPNFECLREYADCGLDTLQIHSRDCSPIDFQTIHDSFPAHDLWISFNSHMPPPSEGLDCVAAIHYDSFDPKSVGGTGRLSDWKAALELKELLRRPFILAGGLTPANVANAVEAVRPDGVDVSSGVEKSPGVKDMDKLILFIRNARTAFDSLRD